MFSLILSGLRFSEATYLVHLYHPQVTDNDVYYIQLKKEKGLMHGQLHVATGIASFLGCILKGRDKAT